MDLTARILGGILLVPWFFWVLNGRIMMKTQGCIMHATVFQWAILPFIVAVGLLLSGRLLPLILGYGLLFFLAVPFPSFFLFSFPLAAGAAYGETVFEWLYPHSTGWHYGGCAVGFLVMGLICSVIVAWITTPPKGFRLTSCGPQWFWQPLHPPTDMFETENFLSQD